MENAKEKKHLPFVYPNERVLKGQRNTYCVPDALRRDPSRHADLRVDRGRDVWYLPHTRLLCSGEGSRSCLRPIGAWVSLSARQVCKREITLRSFR
jgi:hypothetical protein